MGKILNPKKRPQYLRFIVDYLNRLRNHLKFNSEWPFENEFKNIITFNNAKKLKRIGLVPVDIISVSIGRLNVQFRHEWPVNEYTEDPSSRIPLKLIDSPFAEFIDTYQKIGQNIFSDSIFKTLSYYNMWKNIDKIGFRYDWYNYPLKIEKTYSDEQIVNKMIKFINVYESIKKYGYLGGEHAKGMIQILDQPFENLRFGFKHQLDGYEVWSGHHRAVSLFSLGFKNINALLLNKF